MSALPRRAPAPAETGSKLATLASREPPCSDPDLVYRIRAGDRWAEAELYRRFARNVSNLAARLLRDRDDAADVLQDTFVTALENIDAVRDPTQLRTWLLQIAMRLVHRRFRRRRMLTRLGFVKRTNDDELGYATSQDASPELRAEVAALTRVLSMLPARQSAAFVLHHVEGESLEVTAAICGVSLATVKRDLAAARAAITPEGRR